MKVAYICEPQVGGTFVFFTQIRPLLASHGIDFRCIPPLPHAVYQNSVFNGQDGVDFLHLPSTAPDALETIIQHLKQEGFSAVLVLPGGHILGSALPAYLPRPIGCVAKIPHNGRGTYRPAHEFEPYIDAFTPVNYLLADDLEKRYGVPKAKLNVIHIGIDPNHFSYVERGPRQGPLRLIFVGRLNDLEKNICLLPDMVKIVRTRGIDVHCTVVGSGDDRIALEKQISRKNVGAHFTLTGALPYAQIPALLHQSDVFLMPSRFEGCPHALMEAMSTGCVPVASRLRGTLDRIVEHEKNGLLCKPGDAISFADNILRLAKNDELRLCMGREARRVVLERFTVSSMAAAYAAVFQRVAARPAQNPDPLEITNFTPPRSSASTWRRLIPMPVKKTIRTLYARLGKSI